PSPTRRSSDLATALALRPIGIFMRMTRGSMLEVINSDYVRTARAKGASEASVNLRHALRNALIPLLTLVGLEFSGLMGGVVVIDTLFSIPGFGRLIYSAFLRSDFVRSEEHTSELQSRENLVCRLLLEKKHD